MRRRIHCDVITKTECLSSGIRNKVLHILIALQCVKYNERQHSANDVFIPVNDCVYAIILCKLYSFLSFPCSVRIIPAFRTVPGRYCSDTAVAEILNSHLHHKGNCYNNSGVVLSNSWSFSMQLGYQFFSNFTDGKQVIIYVFANLDHMSSHLKLPGPWQLSTGWNVPDVYSDMLVLTGAIMNGYHNTFCFVIV